MKLYKITDIRSRSKYDTIWGNNCTRVLPPVSNPQLCTSNVFHAYTDKNLALLLNPIHSKYQPFQLWKAKGKIVVKDWGKVGCFELTTIEPSKIPKWYTNKSTRLKVCIGFARLCANAAAHADAAACAADVADAACAVDAAAHADAAADAARAAAWAADAAGATTDAITAAARAADAAAWAADAARAARAAGAINNNIDFIKMAKQAIKEAKK